LPCVVPKLGKIMDGARNDCETQSCGKGFNI
jgi:hypothetical protein